MIISSCASVQISSTTTSSPTNTLTATKTNTPTRYPTITRKPTITPTITITPTSTLSPEQYPKLQDLVLTVDDLSNDPAAIFAENFIGLYTWPVEARRKPIIKDLTQEIISNEKCELDCSWQSWARDGLAIYIMAIRTSDTEYAVLLSKTYYDERSANARLHLPDISGLWEGIPSPPNTWVVRTDGGYYFSLGTTSGTIFIMIDMYQEYHGDDFTADVELMLNAANLQIKKLRLAGIPGNP